jgi:peroxiredoxin
MHIALIEIFSSNERKGPSSVAKPRPVGQERQQEHLFHNKALTAIFGSTVATMSTRIIVALIVIGTLVIISAGLLHPSTQQTASTSTSTGLQIGSLAPNFTLSTPDGKRLALSDYRGKTVMLNFWYATCPGCLQEMPAMQKFYADQQAAGKNFVILGVNILDDAQTASKFAQQHKLSYPIVLDQNQQALTLYNVNDTPTSYFIDGKGIIRSIVVGPVDEAILQHDATMGT